MEGRARHRGLAEIVGGLGYSFRLDHYNSGLDTDAKAGRAVTTEQVTLYGLPLVSDRVVGLDRVDVHEARAWFISRALVHGEWRTRHDFLARNGEFLSRLDSLSSRVRGGTLLDPEDLFHFYDERVGDDVVSGRHFDKWWKETRRTQPHLCQLKQRLCSQRGDTQA